MYITSHNKWPIIYHDTNSGKIIGHPKRGMSVWSNLIDNFADTHATAVVKHISKWRIKAYFSSYHSRGCLLRLHEAAEE